LFGPCSFRQSDLTLLDLSEMTRILDDINVELGLMHGKAFAVYGDSIYRYHPHDTIQARFVTEPLSDEEILLNALYGTVRISVEWGFKETSRHWLLIKNHDKIKLLQSERCKFYYVVATLLRNAYTCMYENQISKYFRPDNVNENITFDTQCLIPPSVHAYFQTFANN